MNYRDLLDIKGIEGWKPAMHRILISDGGGEIMALGDIFSRFQIGDTIAGIWVSWIP